MAEPEHEVTQLAEFRGRRPEGLLASGSAVPAGAAGPEPSQPLPAGTVTFLLTDIAGSTSIWEREAPAMAKAVGRHYAILDTAVSMNGGVRPVEQGEGDSMVAAFVRASDAAAAALDAQRAFLAEDWPEGAAFEVRMALHTGEAQIRDDLFYVGPSIIRCARLRNLAHGGQVLISNTTADLLADALPDDAALLPLGVHRLRDLRQPERVFQLAHPDLPARFPPLRSLEALPNNLPVQLSTFIGREAELNQLAELLAQHRLVTIVGTGGSGKTRLALQAAAELAEEYPDGVWWVDLAPVSDPDLVPQTVMGSFGLFDNQGLDPLARIQGYLGDQRVLLVLDNCEHLLRAVALLVDGILQRCPGVRAVTTSRESLGVPGEVAWTVRPLSLPSTSAQSPDELLASESVRLFVDRAAEARPSFWMDVATGPVIAAICHRLDGLPLAIELAAARVRSLSPQRILDGLGDRFRLLTGGARTAAGRQQTLQASVEWSHALLSDREQILFRRLAAFSGSFGLPAAEEICAGEPLEDFEILTLLSDLVEKSLVLFDGERYRLLQTIHDFARERLLAAGEADGIRERHTAWFLDLAESSAVTLERAADSRLLSAVEDDHDNLRAALAWMLARGDSARALRLVGALTMFWTSHGHYSEARDSYAKVLAAAPAEPTADRARALWGWGHVSLHSMDYPGGYGVAQFDQVIKFAGATDDPVLLARALTDLGAITGFAAPDAGLAMLDEAHEAARRSGDAWTQAWTLCMLAIHQGFHRDRADLAGAFLEEFSALPISDNAYLRVWRQIATALLAWRRGDLREARREMEAAWTGAWDIEDPTLEAWTAGLLADIQINLGDWEAVTSGVTRSLTWICGSAFCRAEWVQFKLAEVALANGDLTLVQRHVDQVSPVLRKCGIPFLAIDLDLVVSRAALEAGDTAAAASAFERVQATADTLGTPWYAARAAIARADLARASEDAAAAEESLHDALTMCVGHGFRSLMPSVLEGLGSLAGGGGSHPEATRLLGAADALREVTGQARWPIDQPAYEVLLAGLREALGDELFDDLWSEGRNLSVDEAALYASRARGERKRPASGWAALTPTELQVVSLAAGGLSNAAIGQRLFITAGTVKVHLSNIYRKLGVANRTQLATQATERGLGA